MKLIKKLETRRNKNGKMYRLALFYCEYCNRGVEKPYLDGLRFKSCGCMQHKLSNKARTKHGDARVGHHTNLYNVWRSMKQRCCDKNNTAYKWYGGRGVKVCATWKKHYIIFKTWAENNGYKANLAIDRKDNSGNYKPNNCRFVTRKINMQNSRNAKLNLKQVQQIRSLHFNVKIPQTLLGKIFYISKGQISSIVNNKQWID